MNRLKLIILLLTLCFVTACDVEFDEDLRAYIDNIVDRSPLDFTLEGDGVTEIDDNRAINLGHPVDGYSAEYTITNHEDVNIQITATEAVSGAFSIAALEAFTLNKGESFTFTVTYNVVDESINKRVNHSYDLIDKDGRTFNFVLWASNREHALTFYNATGDEEISELDLGNWEGSDPSTFIIKNEGLADVTVSSIVSTPTDITIDDASGFTLAINEEREITLRYNYDSNTIINTVDDNDDTTGLIVTYDYAPTSPPSKKLNLIAGGSLPLEVVDEDSVAVGPSDAPVFNIGTYEGTAISKTITIQNNTEKAYTLVVTKDDEGITGISFPTLGGDITIEAGGTYSVQINFAPDPENTGDHSRGFTLRNESTGRELVITIQGSN